MQILRPVQGMPFCKTGRRPSSAERSSNLVLQPQASFVIMDQKTGQVKAISGGRGDQDSQP